MFRAFARLPIATATGLQWLVIFTILVGNMTSGRFLPAQQTQELQHFWEIDPLLEDTWQLLQQHPPMRFDLAGLDSPLAETRLSVAQQLCRVHDNPNFKEHADAGKKLLAKLNSGEANVQIRRAMVSAAMLVGDASYAAPLWDLVKEDPMVSGTVERALVKWKSPAAIATWRQRAHDATAPSGELLVAIEGLSLVGSEVDVPDLVRILTDHRLSSACKLHASRALGAIVTEGQNALAQHILDSNVDQRHLLAALVLSGHSGETTTAQLKYIIENGSASAQGVAYRTITNVNLDVALDYAPALLASNDNILRELAIKVLQQRVSASNLQLQATALDDRNPSIRQLVTQNLLSSAAQGEREIVDKIVTQYLDSATWTGVEQAIMLTVGLQDRSRCESLLHLLDHPHPEVSMRAGWALMKLAEDSVVLARMLEHTQIMTEKFAASEPVSETDQIRLSYLFESFGRNLYRPAYDMLLRYVPKDNFKFGVISRASAIWALGKMNRDQDNSVLRVALHQRIQDAAPLLPEDLLVRYTSTLACGEMGQADTLKVIELYGAGYRDPLSVASRWACDRIRKQNGLPPAN